MSTAPANPQLANELFVWLVKHLDLPFVMKRDPAYAVQVDGYALKTRIQLLERSKRWLARATLIIGAVCGFGIGWSLPW